MIFCGIGSFENAANLAFSRFTQASQVASLHVSQAISDTRADCDDLYTVSITGIIAVYPSPSILGVAN